MKHTVWFLPAVLTMLCAAAAADDCKPLRLIGSIPLTASENSDRLYVPVEIAGVPKRMLLDTGANQTLISEVAANELKLPLKQAGLVVYGLTGASSDKYTEAQTKIGGLNAGKMQYMVAPMLNEFDKPDVVGLLGANILSLFDVSIDPVNLKLDLIDSDHCQDHVIYWPASVVTRLPVEKVHTTNLIITVEIDGKPIKAILDTGAGTSSIRINAAQRLFGLTPGSPDTPVASFLNENRNLTTYRHVFKKLSFEGVSVANPEFELIPDKLTKLFTETPTGSHITTVEEAVKPDIILGMNVLKHMRLYIAYKSRLIYFTPADTTKPPSSGAN